MSEITSRPYQPKMACERCCFGRGPHAEFCEWRVRFVEGDWMRSYSFDPEKWREQWTANRVNMNESERVRERLFGCDVVAIAALPLHAVALVSPRGRTVTYDAKGNELSSVWEPEEEWLKRCAVITNVKERE